MHITKRCKTFLTSGKKSIFYRPRIALTFDDGHFYADQVYEKLKQHKVKATFFLCGCYFEKYSDIYKNIAKAGHEIANHSYHHPSFPTLSEAEIIEELSQTQQLIDELPRKARHRARLFRFPYSKKDTASLQMIKKQGYTPVSYTIDTQDWTKITAEEISHNVLGSASLSDGAIVLMHTSGAHTVEALDLIIPALKKQKYKFVLASSLLDHC